MIIWSPLCGIVLGMFRKYSLVGGNMSLEYYVENLKSYSTSRSLSLLCG